jgi:hypothetical protein
MSVGDVSNHVQELIELIINYVKQQTLVPLKRLLRYLALGIAGAIFVAIGLFLLSLGFLRYLQTLSPFESTYSFAPYLIVSVTDIAVIGILFFFMTRSSLIKARNAKD